MTKQEQQFIELLDKWELDIFSAESLKNEQGVDWKDWEGALRLLVKAGYLRQIERGKYCRQNFQGSMTISRFLAPEGAIAYWSALHLHGLTERFPNKVFVQTDKLKKDKKVFGVEYQFVKVLPRKLVGFEMQGFGNHQYRITDREKTIVDCFDLPQYSGGLPELMQAVAEGGFEQEKFIAYCEAVSNIAATKRLAFLVELLGLEGMKGFLAYAKGVVRNKYNLFDPAGREVGEFNATWKLRLNIPKTDILEIAGKIY